MRWKRPTKGVFWGNRDATKTSNWVGARDKFVTNAMETANQKVNSGETAMQQKIINFAGVRDEFATNAMETAHPHVDSGETHVQQKHANGQARGANL